MLVSELIEQLQAMPHDAEVVISGGYDEMNCTPSIEGVNNVCAPGRVYIGAGEDVCELGE